MTDGRQKQLESLSFWHDFVHNKSRKKWFTFNTSRTLARLYGFSSIDDYRANRPKRLPCEPHKVYADEWKNWSNYLGTKPPAKLSFPSFEDAKTIVKLAGIKTCIEYKKQRPTNLPACPDVTYKNEWKGWPDYLGAVVPFVPFEIAQEAARRAGIKSSPEYKKTYKTLPGRLPRHPNLIYKDEWIDWYDFLGNSTSN